MQPVSLPIFLPGGVVGQGTILPLGGSDLLGLGHEDEGFPKVCAMERTSNNELEFNQEERDLRIVQAGWGSRCKNSHKTS